MHKSSDEYEAALDVLFDKMEEACKTAGLDIKIEYEADEPELWTAAMWVEGGMLSIYGGEVIVLDSHYKRFLKWAQIERATSVAELPEGLADSDVRIREKAEAKRRELSELNSSPLYPIDATTKGYILEEFQQQMYSAALLRATDFSAARLNKDNHGYYVGPISLNAGLERATLVGNIYLDDELAKEVMCVSQIVNALTIDELPEALASDNVCIKGLAKRRYRELTGKEPTDNQP